MLPPVLALTIGDVAGIGPEVVLRACLDERVQQWCRPLVVGHPAFLQRAADLLRTSLDIVDVAGPAQMRDLSPISSRLCCWNPSAVDAAAVPLGQNDARSGRAAYDYLVAATRAALAGEIDGITTAPLSKAALHLAGRHYPGHTEILAEECGVRDFAMMLYLPPGEPLVSPDGLGVVHVTLHTSIRSVPDLLSTAAVSEKTHLLRDFLRRIIQREPRMGVCALNPHAGEEGLFGDEEARIIAPAVLAARQQGLTASGPLPADTLLQRAVGGEFDGVVAMYHDQGHIALKLIGFHRAVNVTLGLPIVRTSPSHGTAFDIAGQGRASASGMIEAIRVATLLCGTSANEMTSERERSG